MVRTLHFTRSEMWTHQRVQLAEVHFLQLPSPTHPSAPLCLRKGQTLPPTITVFCRSTSLAVVSLGMAMWLTSPSPRLCIWGHLFCFYCFWPGLWYSFTDQITASCPHWFQQLLAIHQSPALITKGRIINKCVQANRCCHLKNRSI